MYISVFVCVCVCKYETVCKCGWVGGCYCECLSVNGLVKQFVIVSCTLINSR